MTIAQVRHQVGAFFRHPHLKTPGEHVSLFFVGVYALAYFGVWMALLTPPIVSLALRVAEIDPANKEINLSWVLGAGAVVAMFTNPIAGLLSDRTTARMGMRRPWLIGGMALGLAGLYMIATGNLLLVIIGWCIAQLGFNSLLAAFVAILPDQVPEKQRGTVSGVLGVSLQLGIVAGVYLAGAVGSSMFMMFMLPGAIAAVLILLLVIVLEDRHISRDKVAPLNLPGFFRSFLINPREKPDFCWAFAGRFFLFIGLATLMTYQVYYLIDVLHYKAEAVPPAMLTVTLFVTVTTVIGSAASGWLSDKYQRRKPFVILAALIYGSGLFLVGHAVDFNDFLLGVSVCGLGQGTYLAVDLALVTQVLPNQEADAAKDLGIFNLASALPQSVAPAIAPIFLAIGAAPGQNNYTALFTAAATFAALGGMAVMMIRGVK